MPLEENRPLLDGFRRGEREALDHVYREYAEEVASVLVHGFAFTNAAGRAARFNGISSRFDLEDVLQEVFVRAFAVGARLAYDGLRPYGPYLLAIARSAVLDRLRRHGRWEACVVVDEEAMNEVPLPPDAGHATDLLEGDLAVSGNPTHDLENAELIRLLAEFQQGLTRVEAEVFRLRFREGLSLAEVERATGRSPSRVKTLERKLRQRLFSRIWDAGCLENRKFSGGWIARLLSRNVGKSSRVA